MPIGISGDPQLWITGESSQQDMDLVFAAIALQRNFVAAQDPAVQNHLLDTMADARWIFQPQVEHGFIRLAGHRHSFLANHLTA